MIHKVNTHMQCYLYATLIPHQYPHITNNSIKRMIKDTLDIINLPTDADIEGIRHKGNRPKKTQLVHALLELGYTSSFIENYLQIDQSTVSYHKKKETYPYANTQVRTLILQNKLE